MIVPSSLRFLLAVAVSLIINRSIQAGDQLIPNMGPNEKVVVGNVEFEVFRMESTEPDKAAFPIENYRVFVGKDGLLYTKKRYGGSGNVLASTYLSEYSAKFIVDKSGQLYVFHNGNSLDTKADKDFLFAEPEVLAAGNIIIAAGKILAMTPDNLSGFPTEKALIRYLLLLRNQGYEEIPLVLRESDSAFGEVLKFHRTHGLAKDFHSQFLRTFSKHLESIDHHLKGRLGGCRESFLKGYKGKILRI